MTVLPSGGRSCREGEASSCNVNPEEIKIIMIKKRIKLSLSSCNKPRCSEVWARRVITHEFSNKPNVNWIMAEENNFHLLNCKLGLFPVHIWNARLQLGFSFYFLIWGDSDRKYCLEVSLSWLKSSTTTRVTDTHPLKHIWYHCIGQILLFQCHEPQYLILLHI